MHHIWICNEEYSKQLQTNRKDSFQRYEFFCTILSYSKHAKHSSEFHRFTASQWIVKFISFLEPIKWHDLCEKLNTFPIKLNLAERILYILSNLTTTLMFNFRTTNQYIFICSNCPPNSTWSHASCKCYKRMMCALCAFIVHF